MALPYPIVLGLVRCCHLFLSDSDCFNRCDVSRKRGWFILFPLIIFIELYWAHHLYPAVADEKIVLEPPALAKSIIDRDSRIISLYHENSPLVTANWHCNWSQPDHGDYPLLKDTLPMYAGLIHKLHLMTFNEWSPLHYSNYMLYAANAPELGTKLLKNFNVKYVVTPYKYELFGGSSIFRDANIEVKEVQGISRSNGFDFRIPNFTHMAASKCMLALLSRQPGTSEVLLDGDDPKITDGWALTGRVSIVKKSSHSIILDIDVNQYACLVSSEIFDPGWEAFLDETPTTLFRGDLLFRSYLIPEGTHKLKIQYNPISYRLGLFATLSGILLVMILCLSGYKGRLFSAEQDSYGYPHSPILALVWNLALLAAIGLGFYLKSELWCDNLANWIIWL